MFCVTHLARVSPRHYCCIVPTPVRFQQEPLTHALWDEALPLLVPHWQEVSGHLTGAPLAPDLARYAVMWDVGVIRVFTARLGDMLVGYALFTITASLHCRNVLEAQQDAIYLDPSSRGHHGADFLDYCTERLFDDGVQVIYQFTPKARDFGAVLERRGFEALGTLYALARPVAV